jgi:nickel/cobalt exporter
VPPQDLTASVEWSAARPAAVVPQLARSTPSPTAGAPGNAKSQAGMAVTPPDKTVQAGGFAAQQEVAAGTVVRGDFLSRFLRAGQFGPLAILLGLVAAFGLGAVHALSPGHGKALVAAYLVGSRGTLKHALVLGLTVMLTHTISVFALGVGVLFFQQYFSPERMVPVLATLSGASLVAIGAWLFWKRLNALAHAERRGHSHSHEAAIPLAHAHPHHDSHDHAHHDHVHEHAHGHVHSRAPAAVMPVTALMVETGEHEHNHGGHRHHELPLHSHHEHGNPAILTHSHGGATHTHAIPEGKVGLAGLIALGASGGLVPCPSALILLLGAIALQHTGVGLVLLGAFSAGLAVVLMAIGAAVVYAKDWLFLPGEVRDSPILRLLPVMSSVAVMIIGVLMTLSGLGWIRPLPFLT